MNTLTDVIDCSGYVFPYTMRHHRQHPLRGARQAVRQVRLERPGGVPAPVVLASTNEAVLAIVPLEVLQQHAVDVPGDLSSLEP